MSSRTQKRWAGAALGLGLGLGSSGLYGVPAADSSHTAAVPIAQAHRLTVQGKSVGEVDVNGREFLRIRAAAGGLTPGERADVVAHRLNRLHSTGSLSDVRVQRVNGEFAVTASGQTVVTASSESARSNHLSRLELADLWANNLRSSLSTRVAQTRTYVGTQRYGAPVSGILPEHNADKLVPLISAGDGTRIGAAMVTGPASLVGRVAAVAQLEVVWQRFADTRVLVPISNPRVSSGLSRVPEVSVYAIGNFKL